MSKTFPVSKPLAAAALFLAVGTAQAEITVYTSEASFMEALTAGGVVGVDSFDDLPPAEALPAGPLSRSAGGIAYTAQSGPGSDLLFGAGSSDDAWLSTNLASDSITFSGFAPGIYGAGAYVFGSNIDGEFLRRGSISITATNVDGEVQTVTSRFAPESTFFGFVSDSALSSLSVSAGSGIRAAVWPTVDDLVLASAVPEPQTYALLLSGLAAVGFVARRRRIG